MKTTVKLLIPELDSSGIVGTTHFGNGQLKYSNDVTSLLHSLTRRKAKEKRKLAQTPVYDRYARNEFMPDSRCLIGQTPSWLLIMGG